MKRVYLSVRSLLSAGASLLLGWLGFASCDSIGMEEYGTPTVDYEFKVRVTDQDAKPVEGLQVDLPDGRGDKMKLTDRCQGERLRQQRFWELERRQGKKGHRDPSGAQVTSVDPLSSPLLLL